MAASRVGTKPETWLIGLAYYRPMPPMTATYLETLNREQRRAVEHDVQTENGASGAAPFVIAGAGSGKTTPVAHRVAHLIVNGADPRRILLMTFSRRAAAETTRRVE